MLFWLPQAGVLPTAKPQAYTLVLELFINQIAFPRCLMFVFEKYTASLAELEETSDQVSSCGNEQFEISTTEAHPDRKNDISANIPLVIFMATCIRLVQFNITPHNAIVFLCYARL